MEVGSPLLHINSANHWNPSINQFVIIYKDGANTSLVYCEESNKEVYIKCCSTHDKALTNVEYYNERSLCKGMLGILLKYKLPSN